MQDAVRLEDGIVVVYSRYFRQAQAIVANTAKGRFPQSR